MTVDSLVLSKLSSSHDIGDTDDERKTDQTHVINEKCTVWLLVLSVIALNGILF